MIKKYKCVFADRYVMMFFLCLSTPLFSLEAFLFFQIQIIYLFSLFLDMQPCKKQLPSNYLKHFSKGKKRYLLVCKSKMLLLSKLKFLFMSFTCVVETQMPEDFWYSCGLFYSSLVSCYLCVEKKRLLATLSSRISFFKSPTCEKKCITCERSFLTCEIRYE